MIRLEAGLCWVRDKVKLAKEPIYWLIARWREFREPKKTVRLAVIDESGTIKIFIRRGMVSATDEAKALIDIATGSDGGGGGADYGALTEVVNTIRNMIGEEGKKYLECIKRADFELLRTVFPFVSLMLFITLMPVYISLSLGGSLFGMKLPRDAHIVVLTAVFLLLSVSLFRVGFWQRTYVLIIHPRTDIVYRMYRYMPLPLPLKEYLIFIPAGVEVPKDVALMLGALPKALEPLFRLGKATDVILADLLLSKSTEALLRRQIERQERTLAELLKTVSRINERDMMLFNQIQRLQELIIKSRTEEVERAIKRTTTGMRQALLIALMVISLFMAMLLLIPPAPR